MSQENVEVVRLTFEAIGRWDIDALLKLYDPEIEYLPLTGTRVESGGYVGHAGVREYSKRSPRSGRNCTLAPTTCGPSAHTCSSLAGARCGAEAAGRNPTAPWLGAYGPGRQGHPPPRLPNPRGGPRRRGTEGVAHSPDVAECCAA
jgi:ketosteroid isomerase-like protein